MKSNVIIFGDSYSTFKGYIPEGYATYYSEESQPERTDVTRVDETWWYGVMEEAGLNLVMNNSWSGSTMCHTGYNDADCSKTSSFICRLRKLTDQGFFKDNRIDKVFVFGGTNDSWTTAPIGEEMYEGWEEKDLFCKLPGVSYFLYLLKSTLPEAEIYCLFNPKLKPYITDCMMKSCEKYGITPITFEDVDKINGHPTIKGMQQIKEGVLKTIKAKAE